MSATSNKDPAEDVEVMIKDMKAIERGACSDSDPQLSGMMLHWSWTPDTTRAQIPAGGARLLDVAYVRKKDQKKDLTAERIDKFWIRVAATPKDKRNQVCWEVTGIDLLVTARNADPRWYQVKIRFDGLWEDEPADMKQHFALESVTPLPLAEIA